MQGVKGKVCKGLRGRYVRGLFITLSSLSISPLINAHPMLQIHLSDIWKKKYKEWLEVEVFSCPHDWDSILSSPAVSMEIKSMEF